MPLLSFPVSPTNGQLYPATPLVGENQYEWVSAEQTWRLRGTATGVVAGCYGDATSVSSFCVDATGRITSAANVPISATIPDLQIVTDQGAVSINAIDVAGLTAAGLTYPTADGAANDVLVTDGAGNLSFAALPTETLQSVTDNGATTTNAIDVAGLTAAGLIYPNVDGSAGDFLTTDGAGNLSWINASLMLVTQAASAPLTSMSPGSQGQVASDTTYFYYHDGTNWNRVAWDTTPW